MYILNIVKYLPKCVIYNAILCFVHLRNRCDSEELDNHWKIEMCDQSASSEANRQETNLSPKLILYFFRKD